MFRKFWLAVAIALVACSDNEADKVNADGMTNPDSRPIIVEQVFPASTAKVWRAITDPAEMPRWFFEPIAEFEPRVGFETQFTVVVEENSYVHLWKIVDVVPEQRIVYQWRYGGLPGDSTVTWELSQVPDGSKLRLTHVGHETFTRDDPNFSREAGLAGWRYFIQESLKNHLASAD